MSVIGIDFGNESCYVATAKAGGLETLANDYSLRATPSCVAFAGKKRVLGVAAKNQMVTNMKNTISGFKRLLGRKFNDPYIQKELSSIPYKVEQRPDGGIGIRVNYLDQEHVFTPEQITAMLFTKLKETSANALQTQVKDCVIAVPVYFTNAERKALLNAAEIAGLNVTRLLNETTATALLYGFYKLDLTEDKPRNVIFVDCGHASLQVSACTFTTDTLKMLANTWDQVGGRDFDAVLADYFAKEFQDKYKINAKSNARAYLRLLTEVEKLKKQMSANSTKLPLNIECFMEEIDVHSHMQRTTMEELCSHIFQRIEQTLKRCLKESKLSLEEIHSVEIVGGSTRIPAIKNLIEQVFGKPASTTLNQDESVSRGAALQCAIVSPTLRVRDFTVQDILNYSVRVGWEDDASNARDMVIFPPTQLFPVSRAISLNRSAPFSISIFYDQPIPYPDTLIGCWYVKDVKSNEKGEPQEVKVKVRIDPSGIIYVSSATQIEKKEKVEEVPNEEQQQQNQQQQEQPQQQQQCGEPMEVVQEDCNEYGDGIKAETPTASSPTEGQGFAQRVKGWLFTSGQNESQKDKKKKVASKVVDLVFEGKTHGYSQHELQSYHEQEAKMISNDEREKERIDVRNALEEYVYDMREKLQEEGPLASYVNENDRLSICNQLNDLENWLYEEGEDCDRDTYKQKLVDLHHRTDPIKSRAHEYETHPSALDDLGHAIQLAFKVVDEHRAGSVKYDHLTETEIINITEAAEKASKWLDEARCKLMKATKSSDPPVKLAEIRATWQTLSNTVSTIANRPKPKPPTPPTANQQNKQNAGNEEASTQQQHEQNGNVHSDGGSPDGNPTAGNKGSNKGAQHDQKQSHHQQPNSNNFTEDTMDVE